MGERERVKDVLYKYGLSAKKSFGQNFLVDDGIIRRIVKGVNASDFDCVIEIGAGLGSLSIPLSKEAKKLILVESDRDMVNVLNHTFEEGEVQIIQSDFLRFDPDTVSDKDTRLFVGNLPYNITSRLLEYMLEKGFKSAGFMVQKEVFEKLDYQPGRKDNAPMGAFIKTFCDLSLLTYVDRSAFNPVPKVDSAFLKIDRKQEIEFNLYPVYKAMFKDPNKTISNCLKQDPNYSNAVSVLKVSDEKLLAMRARQLDVDMLHSLAAKIAALTKY